MELLTAKAALVRLLGCNVDFMPFEDLKILVRKRTLAWHPDKNRDKSNPNEFSELFIELIDAWKIFCKYNAPGPSSTQGSFSDDEDFNFSSFTRSNPDLFCYESMSESDDEGPPPSQFKKRKRETTPPRHSERESTPEYNSGPFDDDFFIPSPKKKFAIPDDMRSYFRSATNRRAGKCFLIFTPANNYDACVKLHDTYYKTCSYYGIYSIRTDKDLCMCIIMLNNDTRLVDLKKECRKVKLHPAEAFYATKINKCVEFAKETYGEPKKEPTKMSKPNTPDSSKKINYKLISDFALSYEISDAYTLMYEYAHLATPCDRQEVTPEHESDHMEHLENAKIFVHLSDQKRCAKNAVDTVFAYIYTQLKRESNVDYLNRRCREIGNYIMDNYTNDDIGRAWYYCDEVVPNFEIISRRILAAFTRGTPRKRYVCLKGDYKSGKTSFANAFVKLFDGVSINVNVDPGRLPFYLGNAIGRRFVLFDDVKGRCFGSENMSSGSGFHNLDNLRDHIDGHVEVQLEKKNQQPITQVFPCGVITCNDYHIPLSLKERIIGPIEFKPSEKYGIHPPKIISKETIYIGLALKNVLPAEPHILKHLYSEKSQWELEHIRANCKCYRMYKKEKQAQREKEQVSFKIFLFLKWEPYWQH